jgi:hypothetical protein
MFARRFSGSFTSLQLPLKNKLSFSLVFFLNG